MRASLTACTSSLSSCKSGSSTRGSKSASYSKVATARARAAPSRPLLSALAPACFALRRCPRPVSAKKRKCTCSVTFSIFPVADQNHFKLNGSLGNGVYTGGGTWTRLATTTRDPIMRVVLPKAANGTDLKNAPFFIRVRSQPASFAGEAGNTLNPGLTSGQYQLQIRLQQKDEKPGSTIRFADIRYATNAIEVHGLPFHSPLTGESVE